MQFSTPPYLHALSPDEVKLLREVVFSAKDAGLFEQQRFMGDGGDVRNFLANERSRPSPGLLVALYDWAMTELAAQVQPERQDSAEKNELHRKLSTQLSSLYELGMASPRYTRDVTVSMNKFIEGDILQYNVPSFEQRFFIGYRFRTEGHELLRFLVHIFFEESLGRTQFWSYLRLTNSEVSYRETKGFAYAGKGNIYLSGFINAHLGCEFMALTAPHVSHLYSGLVTTTSPDKTPVAKSCVLIEASRTLYDKYLPADSASGVNVRTLRHKPGLHMIPLSLTPVYKDNQIGFQDRLADFLHDTEGLNPTDSRLMSRYLSRRMLRIKYEI